MPAIWKFELRDYDPSWPPRYRAEISELERLLPMVLAFEHVSSKSIQAMAAVPTIDILAGVRKLNEVTDAVIESLIAAGWEHRSYIDAMIPNRRFFHRPPGPRTSDDSHPSFACRGTWLARMARPNSLRDFLGQHPETAWEYVELKRSLTSRRYTNPSDYSAHKADFVAGFKAGDPIANSHAWETVCSLGFLVATRKVKRKVRLLKETSARRD
jgi:GrpB-like predicted nucleotidyltransferase (UPF0157 family)